MASLAGSIHPHSGVNAVDGEVMEKLGQGHPPPGAAMVRSGWRSSYVAIATLLKTKMEFIGLRLQIHWIESLKIRRQEGGAEIVVRLGKTHGESHAHIPFATRQVMCGCG